MNPVRARPLEDFIVGQPRATSALQRALDEDRLFPSLVFHGPPGVGKLSTALLVARTLLCTAEAGRPCDTCRSCRRIGGHALVHPDVRLILPEKKSDFDRPAPEEETVSGIDPQEAQAEVVRNPVWSVLIDRVRQGIGFLQRRPAEGRRSILIVDQAHRMEAPAANTLLKTLEEPPPHALLILVTPSWHALLPTIRSRCQAVPFHLVSRTAIVSYLVERSGRGAEESVLRAGLSGGRIGAALELDLEEFRRRRDALLALLDDLARRGDPGLAVARAETIVHGGESVEGDLEILMTLLRDALILGASPGREAALVNVDVVLRLREVAVSLRSKAGPALDALETTLDAIRHKGNRQLLIETFFMELLPELPTAATSRPRGPAVPHDSSGACP
jgi:DNA polymerase III subunit delta'